MLMAVEPGPECKWPGQEQIWAAIENLQYLETFDAFSLKMNLMLA